MNDVEDARSETSADDPGHLIHDDDLFIKHLEALMESNDPADKKVLNHMVVNAVQTNDVDFYIALMGRGYQLEVLNDKGQTALHIAFYHGSGDIIEYTLKDVWEYYDFHVNYSDCNGLTHLHIVIDYWSEEAEYLAQHYLKSGEDVNTCFEVDPKGLLDGFTPLHMCAVGRESRNDCFKLLINYGANVMARDKMKRTPLHLVCNVYGIHDDTDEHDCLERMTLLLERGNDIDAKDDEGNTPLHNVFILGCKEKFPYDFCSKMMYQKYKLLRDHHADVTAVNNDGNTVLHCVIMKLKHSRCSSDEPSFDDSLHVKIIDGIFSREGIDVNAKNNAGETFLQIAVSMLSVDIVANLVRRNAEISDVTLSRNGRHCFYNDSNFLPNLEIVKNVITTISLLFDGGFEFIDEDKLALMRFLLHENHNSSWMNALHRNKIEAYLDNLLNFGTLLQVQRVYRPMVITLLAKNEVRLKSKMQKFAKKWLRHKSEANLYCDHSVSDFLDLDWSSLGFYVENAMYFRVRPNLFKRMEDEHVIMATTYLNDDVTMLSVLKEHPNDIYQRINDVDLTKITSKFSIYKNIVEGHFTKSLVRNLIEKLVDSYYLKKLVFPALPDICCRMIFFHLENQDILNVFSVVTYEN